MSILQTTELKKYYGAKPNITKALDGVNPVSYTHLFPVLALLLHAPALRWL